MKKFQVLLIAATLIAPISASAKNLYTNNVYGGIGVGGTNFNDRITTEEGSVTLGKLGFLASIYGGYEFRITSPYSLAVELYADHINDQLNASSVDVDEDNNDSDEGVRVSANYRYGIRLLPKYHVNHDNCLHVLLGLQKGNFKARLLDIDDGNQNKRFNKTGIQLGVGGSSQLTQHIAVRGDIIYNNFGSKNATGFNNKLSSFDGLISLVYST